jgi:hypothetical protein
MEASQVQNGYLKRLLETYAENKKIALRFLKETGLLPYWLEYLQTDDAIKRGINSNNWYKIMCPDSIFGKTNFTNWIRRKYGIEFPYNSYSSEMFRYFIFNNFPDIKCRLAFSGNISKEFANLIERENTYDIKKLMEAYEKFRSKR